MYSVTMGRMLQVRNLPDEVHAKLKRRAADERMSLSDFVARELTALVSYRSNAEILETAVQRTAVIDSEAALAAVRESRSER